MAALRNGNSVKRERERKDLDGFPNSITIRANNHSTTNRTIIGELSIGNNVKVPSIEVLRTRGNGFFLRF